MMPRQSELFRRASFVAFFVAVLGAATLLSSVARANPRPLPFTYQSETLPKGAVEVEQFVDFVPTRVNGDTMAAPFLATQFQTEFEVGLTDRLELGLYVSFEPQPDNATMDVPVLESGNGAKQRLRYRLADPEAWPVDVALYGEVAENEREIELEGKIILQRRVGRVRFITNLWAEREFYFAGRREWVLNPTLGVTAELSPRYHLGAESWMRAEYQDGQTGPRGFNQGPHVYVGPAFMMNFGRLWWSNGVYLRVTDIDRATQTADAYGRFWVRTIVGLSF
jgi:hypothetical protein